MSARIDALDQQHDGDVRLWVGMIGLSFLCHLVFFSGVLFAPKFRSSKSYIPSAVEVDLVSLPRPQAGPAAPPQAEKKDMKPPAKEPELVKERQEPVRPVEVKPKETVSLAPQKIEVKKSIKQKTYDASKVIKSAIEKIEKEAPQSRPHDVREAIDKLKQDVEGKSGVVTREGTVAGGYGERTLDLLDIYNAEIWHKIRKNWAYSEAVAGGSAAWEAIVVVKIMKNGDIRDLWFETRSGNSYFDDSALKAIKKSDPLPPLPKGFLGPYHEVGFRFNLSELKRGY